MSLITYSVFGLVAVQADRGDGFGFTDLIAWIIFGLIAGVIAKLLMPGRDPGGCIITILLGIAGAVLGGFLARMIGVADPARALGDRNFFIQLAFAVLGAVIILAVYRLIAGKRT
ncbi:MAG TPA: GlsB/YeaQ/YmgE family stress response membrane protein [Pyrinomonadaceae bacterium]|nr:GlsB/YeaQ/YmgE family stress response membrane protein [Pyrinomonadaceae bacterium]